MRAVLRIRKEPYYRRAAFESGLRKVGFALDDRTKPKGPEDWLVLWNRKPGADENEAVAWERAGGTVIVCENGYLAQVDKTYYAIGVHGHNGSGWFPVSDEDRFAKLGFALKERHPLQGDNIVVRGQRGIGLPAVASPPGWAQKMAAAIRQTGVVIPVVVYEHPGDKGKYEKDQAHLKNAHSLVVWSSAMGVRALVEGVPVRYASPHWVCADPSRNDRLVKVRTAYAAGCLSPEERLAKLHRMAHGQWHFEEIATGEPFARIIERRKEAVWP